jgi:murein DD-endopeptidase MepM/ murein hydrolase activator NlpD
VTKWFGSILGIMLLPLLCGAVYVVLMVLLVSLSLMVVPGWAKPGITAWMMDLPQDTYAENITSSSAWEEVRPLPKKDGYIYSGDENFRCILPPAHGYLTDIYGSLREGGYVHGGIDYGCYYKEQPVRTPMAGKVIFADYGDGVNFTGLYGNLVVIENNGYRVYLAHNADFLVSEGDILSAGDLVSRCGSTGNSSGNHVHMETRVWDGERWVPQDPNNVRLPGQDLWCDWNSLQVPE